MPTPEADNARKTAKRIVDKKLGIPDTSGETKPNRPLFSLAIVCPDCKTRAFYQERESPGFISTPQFPTCPDCGSTGLFVQATFIPSTK